MEENGKSVAKSMTKSPAPKKKQLVEAFGKVIQEKSLVNEIKVKFQEYLDKLNDNDTKNIGFKELKLLITKYNSKELIPIYLPLLMNFNKNTTNTYKEFQLILIGYTISNGGFGNIGGYSTFQMIVESLNVFMKESSINIHKSCSHVMIEIFDGIPDKNDTNRLLNLLVNPLINSINKNANNGIEVNKNNVIISSCIIFSDLIQHIVKQESKNEEFIEKIFTMLLLILNKYKIETPYLFEAVSSILDTCKYDQVKNKLPYIVQKIIKVLNSNSPSLYLTKIVSCYILLKLAKLCGNLREIENYDQIVDTLKYACKDRVAKVQIAANEALNEWMNSQNGEDFKNNDENTGNSENHVSNNGQLPSSSKLNKLNLLRNLSKMNKDRGTSFSPKNLKEEIYEKGINSLLKNANFLNNRQLAQTCKKYGLKNTSKDKLNRSNSNFNSTSPKEFIKTLKKERAKTAHNDENNNIRIYYKERIDKKVEEEEVGQIKQESQNNPLIIEEDLNADNTQPPGVDKPSENILEIKEDHSVNNDKSMKKMSKTNSLVDVKSKQSEKDLLSNNNSKLDESNKKSDENLPSNLPVKFIEEDNVGTELVQPNTNEEDSLEISKDKELEDIDNLDLEEKENDNFENIQGEQSFEDDDNNEDNEENVKEQQENHNTGKDKSFDSNSKSIQEKEITNGLMDKTLSRNESIQSKHCANKTFSNKSDLKNSSLISKTKETPDKLVNKIDSRESFTILQSYSENRNMVENNALKDSFTVITEYFIKKSKEFENKIIKEIQTLKAKFDRLEDTVNKLNQLHQDEKKGGNKKSAIDELNLSMITEKLPLYESKETERNKEEEKEDNKMGNMLIGSSVIGNSNLLSNDPINCPVISQWQNILQELVNGEYTKAYEIAFNFGDDILLLRLLFITGSCLDNLHPQLANKLLTRIISISRCHLVEEIVYQNISQSVEIGVFDNLKQDEKNEALETLFEYSLFDNTPIGIKSKNLYKYILKI